MFCCLCHRFRGISDTYGNRACPFGTNAETCVPDRPYKSELNTSFFSEIHINHDISTRDRDIHNIAQRYLYRIRRTYNTIHTTSTGLRIHMPRSHSTAQKNIRLTPNKNITVNQSILRHGDDFTYKHLSDSAFKPRVICKYSPTR